LTTRRLRLASYPAAALLFVAAAELKAQSSQTTRTTAAANIQGCTDQNIQGYAWLSERPSDEGIKTVDVFIAVRGLPPGKHAVHIHEKGQCTPCADAGGHFDPGPHGNSNPDGNHPYHTGDLPQIEINQQGVGILWVTTTRITLSAGPLSVFDADGSALIIHVNSDTYCPAGEQAGCAGGGRAACGVLVKQ